MLFATPSNPSQRETKHWEDPKRDQVLFQRSLDDRSPPDADLANHMDLREVPSALAKLTDAEGRPLTYVATSE